jgi:hypothetical protein
MRIKRFASAVVVSLALAACGQGDSGNVMAPDVNALSPAQIDAALGPEVVNTDGNAAVAATNATAVESIPANDAPAPESAPPEPEPASQPADEPPTDDNSAEQPQ